MKIKRAVNLFLVLSFFSVSCSPIQTVPQPRTLTVFAAASLTEAFTQLAEIFEGKNPDVQVEINFAGSQHLLEQMVNGAEVDVFASASKKYMDLAIKNGLVAPDEAEFFVTNRLIVIFPKENPGGLEILDDLAKPGLKLVLADEAVPVGKYSMEFLSKAIAKPGFEVGYEDEVLANVVSYEDNVKAIVAKVSMGEADAGIVYVSDITVKAAPTLGSIEIPDDLNSIASYPIATLANSKNVDLAAAWIDLILSAEGQAILAAHHFTPIK